MSRVLSMMVGWKATGRMDARPAFISVDEVGRLSTAER